MPKATAREILDYIGRLDRGDNHTAAQRNRTTACERNDATLASLVFRTACFLAGLPAPTRRQASKWNARRGLAYAHHAEALRQIAWVHGLSTEAVLPHEHLGPGVTAEAIADQFDRYVRGRGKETE